MKRHQNWALGVLSLMGTGLGCSAAVGTESTEISSEALTSTATNTDDFGKVEVLSTDTKHGIDMSNPFFQSLGTNGRTCNSCHKLENAMGISVAKIQSIFNSTNGTDPIFSINDGSNAPTGAYADISSLTARKNSFSMLLAHGTIRVGIGVPSGADFNLTAVQDPYRFASAAELSLFRRPLPSVNVAFNTLTMWDGRESEGRPVNRDALMNQANDATQGHAQRVTPLDSATRAAIADFQLNLFAAQSSSTAAGALNVAGCKVSSAPDDPPNTPCDPARGGPLDLSLVLTQGSPGADQGAFPKFSPGVNDSFKSGFKNISFTPFDPWESADLGATPPAATTQARGAIGDGEDIFYTKPINITGVVGLNDVLGQSTVHGFCTTCHNTPDVGNHSVARFFNIGTASPFLGDNPLAANLSGFPQYTLRRNSDSAQVTTTDPGLALRTGKYADVARFKVPQLRGLGSRAPYFHNGQAKTLTDVVNFYNTRFNIGFTADEISKVVLFLQQT
jgi:cytochrome c peroxidase